ncbi:MAG: hypothetical protein ACJ75R_04460, partial [Solirubrobacterales bacterium]
MRGPTARLEPAPGGPLASARGNAVLVVGRSGDRRPVVRLGRLDAELFASGMPPEGDFWGLVELPAGTEGSLPLTVSGETADEVEVRGEPEWAPVDSS